MLPKPKQSLKLRLTTKQEPVEEEAEGASACPRWRMQWTLRNPRPRHLCQLLLVRSPRNRVFHPSPISPIQAPISLSTVIERMPFNHVERIEASFAALNMNSVGARPSIANPFTRAAQQMSEVRKMAMEQEMKVAKAALASIAPVSPPHIRTNFAVYCNSCDRSIPEAHYHCSTCDDGDFDLCQDCVDQESPASGADHWLIKRFIKNSVIINSTTERIAPKPKAKVVKAEPVQPIQPAEEEPAVSATLPKVFSDLLTPTSALATPVSRVCMAHRLLSRASVLTMAH